MTGYHDYVLGLIPVTFIATVALLKLAGLSVPAAVPVGGGLSAALIGHALFVRGPVDAPAGADAPDVAARNAPEPAAD